MKLIQICVRGEGKFTGNRGVFYSQTVYSTTPSQEEVDSFVERCCTSTNGVQSTWDLEKKTVKVSFVELELKEE